MHRNRRRPLWLCLGVCLASVGVWRLLPAAAERLRVEEAYAASVDAELAEGQELFHRNWLPDDPRSPEGDGLGPVFNETSCAACHNQGGPGGGGAASKNVELLTAFVNMPQVVFTNTVNPGLPRTTRATPVRPAANAQFRQAMTKQLAAIHPGFETAASVVIHQFGTSPKHAAWRAQILSAQVRNPPMFQAAAASTLDAPAATDAANEGEEEADPAADPAEGGAADVLPDPFEGGDPGATPQAVPVRPNPPADFGDQPAALPAQPFNPVASQPRPTNLAPQAGGQSFPTQSVSGGIEVLTQPQPQFGVQVFSDVQSQEALLATTAATGFPLVDEAVQEIRQLQQQARKDLSSSISRGQVVLLRSQRNTSALFGAGVIDAIPDAAIEAIAKQKHEDFPRVSGRVHRLKDGKIGRFGWKAQKATLRDFTLAACANELGLDVPGHPQADAPYDADQKPRGHDMTPKQADALVAYVKSLPPPVQQKPDDPDAAKLIEEGEKLFESVGCAACHAPNVGKAKGVFSDFLLHDLGDKLQASGHYGSTLVPHESPDSEQGEDDAGANQAAAATKKPEGPTASEWRTPPLWGVRDSAPYLHDGRAATLEQAIAFHGGEASDASIRFFMLSPKKRQRLIAFLKTLRAPEVQVTKRD